MRWIPGEDFANLTKEEKHAVRDLINSLETITYYKHHYVRKTGLKREIKAMLANYKRQYKD